MIYVAVNTGRSVLHIATAHCYNCHCRYIETNVGNITVPGFDSYPDFLAMGLLIVATLLVSIGVNVSM